MLSEIENKTYSEKLATLDQLTELTDEDAEFLARFLATEPNENLRVAGVGLAARSRHAGAADLLGQILLRDGETAHLKRKAIEGLAELGGDPAVQHLIAFRETASGDTNLDREALTALSDIGTDAALTAFAAALESRDKSIKAFVANRLAKHAKDFSDAATARILMRLKDIAANDGTASVRLATLRTIAAMSKDETDFFRERIEQETDEKNVLRAIEAVGQQNTAAGAALLIRIVLRERRQRVAAEAALRAEPLGDLDSKWTAFRELIENSGVIPTSLNYRLLIQAVAGRGDNVGTSISERAFEMARGAHRDTVAICTNIVLEAFSDNRDRAARHLDKYLKAKKIDDAELRDFRIELGGKEATERIFDELQRNLDENFSKPIEELNSNTVGAWKDSIQNAEFGFRVRMHMSIAVFVVGLVIVAVSSYLFLFAGMAGEELWGPSAGLAAGLGSMLLVVYSGPLKDIQASVNDVARANIVFIGFIHSILQLSHTFSASYLKSELTDERVAKLNELLGKSMLSATTVIAAGAAVAASEKGAGGDGKADAPAASGADDPARPKPPANGTAADPVRPDGAGGDPKAGAATPAAVQDAEQPRA